MTKPLALIVDDDPVLRDLFAAALQLSGLETEILEDGRLAVDYMAQRLPQLVMLDMQMPHITGGEVLRQIRADARFAGVKVVIVTANPQIIKGSDIEEKADLVLMKPVTLEQITDFAQRMVQRPNEEDESSIIEG